MNARKLSFLALAVAGLAVAGSVSAQTRTYTFSDRDVAGAPTGGCNTSLTATTGFGNGAFGNAILCQQSGNASTTLNSQTLSVTAWSSDTPSTNVYRNAAVNDQGGNGFGVANRTENLGPGSPQHAADNLTPGVDLWRLDFSTSQALKSVTIGWAGEDGDFQVLRWGGSGAAPTIDGRSAGQLITDGWVLMSAGGTDNVFNGVGGGVNCVSNNTCNDTNQLFTFNSGNVGSSSWLISAYNSAWAGSGATNFGGDAIKILSVTTSGVQGSQISEPGSLLLAALGIGAALRSRRRRSASRA